GRPLLPADVAEALEQACGPRILVTTPVHLRALLRSGVALPALAGIVSATAPLPQELAAEAEDRYGAEVREVFGSTETCVFARRRGWCWPTCSRSCPMAAAACAGARPTCWKSPASAPRWAISPAACWPCRAWRTAWWCSWSRSARAGWGGSPRWRWPPAWRRR